VHGWLGTGNSVDQGLGGNIVGRLGDLEKRKTHQTWKKKVIFGGGGGGGEGGGGLEL